MIGEIKQLKKVESFKQTFEIILKKSDESRNKNKNKFVNKKN